MGRRLLALAVFAGLVVAAVASLPGLGTVRTLFSHASPWLLAAVGLLKGASCVSNVVAFRDVFCPRMDWRFSFQLGMAEQAANVLVPTGGAGGLALGAWVLRAGGMRTEYIARRSVAFFVITSIPNFACAAVLGPLLLLGVFPGKAPPIVTAVFTGLVYGVAALAASMPLLLGQIQPREGAATIERWLRAAASSVARGVKDTGTILRSGRWRAIGGAFGYMGFDTAALWVAFTAFGGGISLGPMVFAYVMGQLGGLLPLPAGVGGTDGGLIGAMVLYGSPLSHAVAAVLAYRLFQLGVPAVWGSAAFLQLRRTLSHGSSAAAACAELAEPI